MRIYSPYLLCGILLILSISTLFSLVTFLEDSSNYKTALYACSSFINESRLTPEGKYFTTFVTNKDPRVQTTAHKKRYVLQNCPSLLKELHATSSAFNYKQTLDIFNKAHSFDNGTREKLNGNDSVPYNSVKYTEMNLVVFKNLLVFKDFILQITDFKKEDTYTSNKDVKTTFESLTSTTLGVTNRDIFKAMNLLFINNYLNVTEKIKKKWDNLLDFKDTPGTGTVDESKLKRLDEKISLLFNNGIRNEIERTIRNHLKTNYGQVFQDYASLHYAPEKPNLSFEDVEKIKDLLKYFEPILNNDSIEKKPKSDADPTLEETNVKKEININSVYFVYQSLYIFFKKDFESVLKYFSSLIEMNDFITLIIKPDNITKITKEVFSKTGVVDSLMKSIGTKLVNIKSYFNIAKNEYNLEYTTQLNNTERFIDGLIKKETDKKVFGMEAKRVSMTISSLTNKLSYLDDNNLVRLVVNNKSDISYYEKVTNQLNLSRLHFKEIDDDVKDRFVKLKVKQEVQRYIKRIFDEFGFYNHKNLEIVNILKEIKELNSKRFAINDQLDTIVFENDDTSVFRQFLKKLIEFVKNNKDVWNDDK